jgi:hypothetical protein
MKAAPTLLAACCALAFGAAPLLAQPGDIAKGRVSARDRFSGAVAMGERQLTGAIALKPRVRYQVMSLAPGVRAAPFAPPDKELLNLPLRAKGGYVVYELRAGKLTTDIDGKKQERREGEFWLVRPGENIVLETADDSVIVQTLQIPGE